MSHTAAEAQYDLDATSDPMPEKTPPSMARVAAASLIGTAIEFYDFFIYGTAAALVFPTIFFPKSDPASATLMSFATFAVAFFARPVGAIIFGHYGDKIGRKRTLVWTLLIMGFSTVMIGLVPGYSTGAFGIAPNGIGVMAPTILVLLRFLQGFAVGGEWAGATLLTAEYAPKGQRGKYGMFPQLGPAVAFCLSSATFLLFVSGAAGSPSDPNGAFIQTMWRVPFLLSSLLVMVGLWIRLQVDETPVFRKAERTLGQDPNRKPPFLDCMKLQWKELLIGAGALATLYSLFYMATSFLTSYATKQLGYSMPTVLTMGILGAVVLGISTAMSSIVSDRLGRRRVIMICCVMAVIWSLMLFPILDTKNIVLYAVGLFGTLLIFGIGYGPIGAALPELFQARFRYTGAGLSYNLGSILGGAIPPLIASNLVAQGNSMGVGVLLAILSCISILATYFLVESKDADMDEHSVL